jgi:hypothetical protein
MRPTVVFKFDTTTFTYGLKPKLKDYYLIISPSRICIDDFFIGTRFRGPKWKNITKTTSIYHIRSRLQAWGQLEVLPLLDFKLG